jgi:hypothetical protein
MLECDGRLLHHESQGHALAIALNLARLYEEVLQEPLPPELRRLVTRLEVAAGSHQRAEARSSRREAERAAVGSGFGTRKCCPFGGARGDSITPCRPPTSDQPVREADGQHQ